MKAVLIIQTKDIADRIEQGLSLVGLTLVSTGIGAFTVREIPCHLRRGKGSYERIHIAPDSGLPFEGISKLVESTDAGAEGGGFSWRTALPAL
jgi:hypothetical protein